jgi:hypothetical protein
MGFEVCHVLFESQHELLDGQGIVTFAMLKISSISSTWPASMILSHERSPISGVEIVRREPGKLEQISQSPFPGTGQMPRAAAYWNHLRIRNAIV